MAELKWISCKEEEPELDVQVAVHWGGTSEVDIDFLSVDPEFGESYWENNNEHPPTHWCSLPDLFGE